MRVGNKKIFHLEAWVVKVMSLYKVSASRGRNCAAPALPSPRIWPGTDLSVPPYRDGSTAPSAFLHFHSTSSLALIWRRASTTSERERALPRRASHVRCRSRVRVSFH